MMIMNICIYWLIRTFDAHVDLHVDVHGVKKHPTIVISAAATICAEHKITPCARRGTNETIRRTLCQLAEAHMTFVIFLMGLDLSLTLYGEPEALRLQPGEQEVGGQ
jgi:hypothetical protein